MKSLWIKKLSSNHVNLKKGSNYLKLIATPSINEVDDRWGGAGQTPIYTILFGQ